LKHQQRDLTPVLRRPVEPAPQDWTVIVSAVTGHKDPLFSDIAEQRINALRAHILRLEQEAAAERT
jgi:hypothetical protein